MTHKTQDLQHVPLCSGFGQYHSNHPTAKTRKPYVSVTLADIFGMVANPQDVPKAKAQWCIPHSDLSEQGREKAHLMQRGQWFALWFDIDAGNHSLETISEAIQAICGNVKYAVYSSKGATESKRKWRGLIPLKEPIGAIVFEHAQAALNEALEARNISPDHASASANQVFYLPNRGAFYQTAINENADLFGGAAFAQPYSERLQQEQEEAEAKRQAQLEAFRARKTAHPNRDAAYIERACLGKLQDASARLTQAPDGAKHDALRKEAALIGGLLHLGAFTQEEASEVLIGAIAARCNSVSQARKTAAAAMKAGTAKPISPEEILSKRSEGKTANTDTQAQAPSKTANAQPQPSESETDPAKEAKPRTKLPPQSKVAAEMLDSIQSRLLFNSITEDWMRYSGGMWSKMEKRAARREMTNALPDKVLEIGYSASYLGGVCSLIEMALADNDWQNRAGLVPFANGVLNLNTGALLQHSPKHRLSWQIPYPYDPSADCPTIRAWLLEVSGGNPDQVELLRAYLRAILTGAVGLQRYMELIGPGGTGKSTFIRLAEAMTGTHNVYSTEFKHLEQNRFETANIYGKRLVVITDSQGYAGDVSVLKAITGQDMLRFEEKNKQGGQGFKSSALVLIASNEPIASKDYTTGLSRRRITVHFKHRVKPNQRRDLDAEFAPELPGLVNWLLSMEHDAMRRYLIDTDSAVESLSGVTRQNLLDTNPLARWLEDCALYDPAQQTQIGIKRELGGGLFEKADEHLYPSYLQWCADNGMNAPLSNHRFSPLLLELCAEHLGLDVEKLSPTQGEHKAKKFIRGLVLNTDPNKPRLPGVSPIEYKYPSQENKAFPKETPQPEAPIKNLVF